MMPLQRIHAMIVAADSHRGAAAAKAHVIATQLRGQLLRLQKNGCVFW